MPFQYLGRSRVQGQPRLPESKKLIINQANITRWKEALPGSFDKAKITLRIKHTLQEHCKPVPMRQKRLQRAPTEYQQI